jgi:hypothetical protein
MQPLFAHHALALLVHVAAVSHSLCPGVVSMEFLVICMLLSDLLA